MNKQILFVLSLVVLISAFLFSRGYKTANKIVESKVLPAFDMDSYIAIQQSNLSDSLKNVSDGWMKKSDKESLKNLVQLWDSIQVPIVAVHYFNKYTQLEPTEGNWFVLGSKYYNIAATDEDSLLSNEAAIQAKKAFEKVMELNPQNLAAKNALAACYIEVDQDVMKGVAMLKEVVETDSNNVQAIYTLAMLSVQSGQYDKAIQRLNKLVTLQPFNAEFYFYLADTYVKYGDAKQAIANYEKCKTLLKDKEAKKEVDTIINKLKNN